MTVADVLILKKPSKSNSHKQKPKKDIMHHAQSLLLCLCLLVVITEDIHVLLMYLLHISVQQRLLIWVLCSLFVVAS